MSGLDGEARGAIVALLRSRRWATLATLNGDATPLATQVAYAVEPGAAALLVHLSTLAVHTRNVLERPACSLSISETDDGRDDPQTLARLTLNGDMAEVARDAVGYAALRDAYLSRLPMAAPRFDFGDFRLLRLVLRDGHYVGGFARAFRLPGRELQALFGR